MLIGMNINLTKKPTNPMTTNPMAVLKATFVNSLRSGLWHRFTRHILSLAKSLMGEMTESTASMSFNLSLCLSLLLFLLDFSSISSAFASDFLILLHFFPSAFSDSSASLFGFYDSAFSNVRIPLVPTISLSQLVAVPALLGADYRRLPRILYALAEREYSPK